MDNKSKGAVGGGLTGAATGAALGSAVPVIGTAIGAGAGALLGGIGGYLSAPDAPQSLYNYSDIDLARDNPELYRQIKELEGQRDQLKQELASRQAGMNLVEARGLQDQRAQTANQLAGQGLLGSSAGIGAQNNAEAAIRAQIQQNAFAQRQALNGQILGADQGIGNAYSSAMANTLAAKNGQIGQNNQNNMFNAGVNSDLLNNALGAASQFGSQYANQQNFDKYMASQNAARGAANPGFTPTVSAQGLASLQGAPATPIYRGMNEQPGVPASAYGPQYSLNTYGVDHSSYTNPSLLPNYSSGYGNFGWGM